MTHRERVLAALNHEEPDRVPIDFGGTLATSINIGAYEKLKAYLHLDTPSEILSLRSMIADVEEEILVRYDVDTRTLPLLGNSRPAERLGECRYKDEWGVIRAQPHPRGHFMDVSNPLDGDVTLIELGVDALNPVQVSAADMDTVRLKRDFGDRIAFWGRVDTQHVLPTGTPAEVRSEVRRRLRDLAPGGGYVLCPVHNIQAEVPPENIDAMFMEALAAEKYPVDVTSGSSVHGPTL